MISDFFSLAITNLRHRKLRSWLTIIGVVIGIATISSIMSLSQGLYDAVNQQFEMMGTNTITILPGSGASASPILSMAGSYLKESDNDIVKRIPGVEYSIPIISKTAEVEYKNEKQSVYVYAMPSKDGKEFLDMFHGVGIIEGREIKKGDKYKAVIGYRVSKDLFNNEIGTGSYITINGVKFKVVGILTEIGNRMDDNTIAIPMEAAKGVFGNSDQINMIYVKVETGAKVDEVAERIKLKLKNAHGKEDFQVLTSKELMQRAGIILDLINIVTLGLALISLLVGAIGIMNTMYMAVIERTREIGIMKAIGAKNVEVLTIFLMESGLIGLVGGAIGLSIGLTLAKLVEVIARKALESQILRMAITPEIIIISLGISLLIGILSGVMPARSAAKLNPVDALRYE